MASVLIADDDRKIIDMLRRTLAYEGYQVVTAADGLEALAQAQAHRPDLIVLDRMMPGLDRLEVARRIRAVEATPILILTARDAIEDLDSGADDYLVKPFAPAELLARLRALLRRTGAPEAARPFVYADLRLDPTTRETRRGGRAFDLSPKEFDLLVYLLRHPRQVLGRAYPGGGLGERFLRRRQCPRCLHRLPAPEDRVRRRIAPGPDGARRGVCDQGVASSR